MLRRSYVLPWPGTMPGAAHPTAHGSILHSLGRPTPEFRAGTLTCFRKNSAASSHKPTFFRKRRPAARRMQKAKHPTPERRADRREDLDPLPKPPKHCPTKADAL